MKRNLSEQSKQIMLLVCPKTKKIKVEPDNMAKNYTRPLSDLMFSNPNPSETSKTVQTAKKYSLRTRKVERMSNSQIEAVINKNEQLEEENRELKAALDDLKEKLIEKSHDELLLKKFVAMEHKTVQASIANSDNETQTIVAAEVMQVIQLKDENTELKAALDDLKEKLIEKSHDELLLKKFVAMEHKTVQASIANSDNETQTIVAAEVMQVIQLKEENRELKAALDDLKEKLIEKSHDELLLKKFVAMEHKTVQASIANSDNETQTVVAVKVVVLASVSTQTIIDDAVEVLESANIAVPKDIIFQLLPWLEVVNRDYEFHSLEKTLIFNEQLQADLIHTMADQMKTPDEYNFMKYFLARLFSRDFFVNTIGFNASGKKVQFKGTIIFRCFAASMAVKYTTPKSNEEPEDEIIEEFKIKIQDFMTDFKLLVKRNPKNWAL